MGANSVNEDASKGASMRPINLKSSVQVWLSGKSSNEHINPIKQRDPREGLEVTLTSPRLDEDECAHLVEQRNQSVS